MSETKDLTDRIATGFDLEPLPDGNVLVEFFADDGKTFNTQVVTKEVVQSMPVVASLTLVYMDQGPEAVKEIMHRFNDPAPDQR